MELRSCHRGGDLTIGFWTKNTWLELQEAAAPKIFAFLIQQFMKAMFLLEMMISHYNVIIAQDLGKQTLALHSLKNKFVFFMMPHRKECASKNNWWRFWRWETCWTWASEWQRRSYDDTSRGGSGPRKQACMETMICLSLWFRSVPKLESLKLVTFLLMCVCQVRVEQAAHHDRHATHDQNFNLQRLM